ncbi:MAG: DUF4267 domain-containing protein [Hyphomicrobiaceae bacterium]|nr:DUF4267 domain-containing protein [Hyphomicrobiaceae bacterium]
MKPAKHRHLLWLSVGTGLLLAFIGIRFLIVPRSAANTFGLAREIAGYELHHIVGLRDIWLGLLAVALAAFREWRALALWFGLGALVCFADASIAAGSSGKLRAIAFHTGSGIVCAWMAAAIWRRFGNPQP